MEQDDFYKLRMAFYTIFNYKIIYSSTLNLLVGGLFGWKWPKTATSISDIFRMIFYIPPAIPII